MARVRWTDLTIYIINDSEHGGSGFKIHLYDYLRVVPVMAVAWMRRGTWKGRVQGSLAQFGQVGTT
jgi:hypothetical protein